MFKKSFKSLENHTVKFKAIVLRNENGLISFDKFALKTFIASGLLSELTENIKDLMLRLTLTMLTQGESEQQIDESVTREEVEELKRLVEFRLTHCESEKENNNPAFNADTYISMKLLLLDIREWLSVTVVDNLYSNS